MTTGVDRKGGEKKEYSLIELLKYVFQTFLSASEWNYINDGSGEAAFVP